MKNSVNPKNFNLIVLFEDDVDHSSKSHGGVFTTFKGDKVLSRVWRYFEDVDFDYEQRSGGMSEEQWADYNDNLEDYTIYTAACKNGVANGEHGYVKKYNLTPEFIKEFDEDRSWDTVVKHGLDKYVQLEHICDCCSAYAVER